MRISGFYALNNMASFFSKHRALAVFALCCLLWIPWLGDTPFYTKGEPREAIVAVTMLESGNWILPVNGGWEYPFKPPLMAWIIAALAWLFNGCVVNEFISRLPSALSAIAMVMAGYCWARKSKGEEFATLMAMVTATSFEVFRAATACRLDMLLTASMVCALYCLFEISARPRQNNLGLYCAAAALLTCAVLTKGPIGVLLPCMIAGVYRLLVRENFWRVASSLTLLALVSFIVPALWYWAAWKQGGQTFFDLAWEENISRFTGTMSYESHENPVWYNFATIVLGMVPWTLYVLLNIPLLIKERPRNLSRPAKFALVAAVAVIVFYSIPASKRSVYLLPAYPFMAYGVAVAIQRFRDGVPAAIFRWTIAVLALAVPMAVTIGNAASLFPPYVEVSGFLGYAILIATAVAAVAWMCGRAKRRRGAVALVYLIYLSYISAVMPALFRHPLKSDDAAQVFEDIRCSAAPVRTIGTGRAPDQVYWFNFYLSDRTRRIGSLADADTLPSGAAVILPVGIDPAPLESTGQWTVHHLPFNPDTRRPVDIAVKSPPTGR